MGNETFEKLQYLYKVLKKHDIEILKHFCEDSISDSDYFFYGINSDIISNSLNILTNYLSGNIQSAGVDNSCRSIIEAFVILLMDADGKISEVQKTIYRYLYAYVDIDNFHSFLNDIDKDDIRIKTIYDDKEKAKDAIIKHFNCEAKHLKNRNIGIDDPCFYLKSRLKDNIKFSKLLELYPINDEKQIKMYEFFSIFIHPRCEMNINVENIIMHVRNLYVDTVLKIVYEYLKNCGLLIDEKENNDISDFNQDFFYNPLLQNNVVYVKNIEIIFNMLIDKLCKLKEGEDLFTWHFLEKSKYLFIDMIISESLGYNEHVITCFKSFVEEFGVLFSINSIKDLREFNYVKKAFWCSSRIQIDNHFKELGWKDATIPESEIKKLYEEYYKEKYQLNDFSKFYNDLKMNSFYFLDKEKRSYNKHVKLAIESIFTDINESKDVFTLYKISKDMSHASGYSFNASEGLVNICAHKAVFYSFKILNNYLLNAAITLNENNEECDLSNIIELINTFIEVEGNEILNKFEKSN